MILLLRIVNEELIDGQQKQKVYKSRFGIDCALPEATSNDANILV